MTPKKRKQPKEPKQKESKSLPNGRDLEEIFRDRDKLINIPKTLLKKEEWGLLTAMNLLLAGIFPAYFVNILLISFFTGVGHLFTTHLTEVERTKLIEFEKKFRKGYEFETAGKWEDAIIEYEKIIPGFKENPKIAGIAEKRIEWIKKTHLKKGK